MSAETLALPTSADVVANASVNYLTNGSRRLTFDTSGLSAERNATIPNNDTVLPVKSGTNLILGSSTGAYSANCLGIGYNLVFHASASNVILLGTGATSTQDNSLNFGSQYTGLYVPGLASGAGTHHLFFDPVTGKITYGTLSSAVLNGTAAAPGLAFQADLDTGFYKSTNLYISTGGTQAAGFTTAGVFAANGVGYSFLADSDTGISYDGTRLGLYTGGTEMLRFSSGVLVGSRGTAAAPAMSFLLDTDSGIYSPSANKLAITTGGVQKVEFDSTGIKALNYRMAQGDYIVDNIKTIDAGKGRTMFSVGDSVCLDRIFSGPEQTYTRVGKLAPSGVGGLFGYAIAASADGLKLIVSCYTERSVYFYSRSTIQSTFSLVKRISGSGEYSRSVAMSGDGITAAVGDTSDGKTYIYSFASGNWDLITSVSGTGGATPTATQGFVCQLNYDGTVLIVGAPSAATNVGGVFAFQKTSGVWAQVGTKLLPSDATGASKFGYAIKLMANGRKFYASGPEDNTNAGAIWMFTYSNGAWTQQGLKINNTSTGNYIGSFIDATEDFIAASYGAAAASRRVVLFQRKSALWVDSGSILSPILSATSMPVAVSTTRVVAGNYLSGAGGMSIYTTNGIPLSQSVFGAGDQVDSGAGASVCLPRDDVVICGATTENSVGAVYYYYSANRILYAQNGLKCRTFSFANQSTNVNKMDINDGVVRITTAHNFTSTEYTPASDDALTLGTAQKRFTTVYSTNVINTSDKNLKQNIKPTKLGLDFLLKLKPVKYTWRDSHTQHYGFLAQEVYELLKQTNTDYSLVYRSKEGHWGLRYEEFLPIIVNAIKELKAIKEQKMIE